MTSDAQLEQLEDAIRNRAQNLANSYLQAAYQQREQILIEVNKRLSKRENREIEVAKANAEQAYRRKVQASEIKMQAELDQLRWSLVQTVRSQVYEHLKQLSQQAETYLPLLKQYCLHAAHQLKAAELVMEVKHEDYQRLIPQWEDFISHNLPNRLCTLVTSSQTFMGGVLVHDSANRIRINNTFEGIMARLENHLYQVITAQLFAATTASRNI
jgi:V/A-type H+-transporting ATPase subunit E